MNDERLNELLERIQRLERVLACMDPPADFHGLHDLFQIKDQVRKDAEDA